MKADLGAVIGFGILAGIPATIVGGIVFGNYIARRIHVEVPEYFRDGNALTEKLLLSFGMVAAIIFIPLALILANTVSGATLPEANVLRSVLTFIGHPFVALLLATLLAIFLLGIKEATRTKSCRRSRPKRWSPRA